MFKSLIDKVIRLIKTDDPVKDCEVYKDKGCGFVDGYLCNMKTCPIRVGYIEGKENK